MVPDNTCVRSFVLGGKWAVSDVRVVNPAGVKVSRKRDRYQPKWCWETASPKTKVIKIDMKDRSGPWFEALKEALQFGAEMVILQKQRERIEREKELAEAAKVLATR